MPTRLLDRQSTSMGSDLELVDTRLQVSEAAAKTAECMKKVVVHHKEELVVPFGVP